MRKSLFKKKIEYWKQNSFDYKDEIKYFSRNSL